MRGYGYMGPGMMGYGYGGWGWMPALMILLLVIVGVVAYIIYRSMIPYRRAAASDDHSKALSIVKERLAKGEITLEEYEKIKKTLEE
jgi:putative membrane protein